MEVSNYLRDNSLRDESLFENLILAAAEILSLSLEKIFSC